MDCIVGGDPGVHNLLTIAMVLLALPLHLLRGQRLTADQLQKRLEHRNPLLPSRKPRYPASVYSKTMTRAHYFNATDLRGIMYRALKRLRPPPGTLPGTPSDARSAAYRPPPGNGAAPPASPPYASEVISTLRTEGHSFFSGNIESKRRYIGVVLQGDGHWWSVAWSRKARLDKFKSWQRRRSFEDAWCADVLREAEKRAEPFVPESYTMRMWFCMGAAAQWMRPTLGGHAAAPKRGLMMAMRRVINVANSQAGKFADGRPVRVWTAKYSDERFTSKISWFSGQPMLKIWTERTKVPGAKPFKSGRARVVEQLHVYRPPRPDASPPEPTAEQRVQEQDISVRQDKRYVRQRVAGQGRNAPTQDHLRLLDFLASERETAARPPSPGHTFLRGLLYCPGLRMYLDRDKAAAIAIAGTAMYELAAASERPDLCRNRTLLKHLRPDVFQPTKATGPDHTSGGFHRAPPLAHAI